MTLAPPPTDVRARPLVDVLGGASARKLAGALDLNTVGDLLDHLPRRYYERGELTDLSSLVPGERVTIMAQVRSVQQLRMKNRPGTYARVTVSDGTGTLSLTFFGGNGPWRKLYKGMWACFDGTVERFQNKLRLTHPDILVDQDPDDVSAELVPVYSIAKDLRSWDVRRAVRALLQVVGELPDPLPDDLRRRRRLVGLTEAYHRVHRPGSHADVAVGRKRLIWDEAFVLQVALAQRRRAAEQVRAVPRRARRGGLLDAFDAGLPYALTDGQRRVGEEIAADLARAHPMHRLLQGEVGSGKTLVALRAMLTAVDAGGQAALLAPTEVLATQHARTLRTLLGPLGTAGELGSADQATRVELLTGNQGTAARRRALAAVADGSAGIVVGTHALLAEGVEFRDLALVVVDEQHRFGVDQRDALRARAGAAGDALPHLLVMTATPIPRTVAMTVFGDLDTSTLTDLPAGRTPGQTFVAEPRWHGRIWSKVRTEVAAGHQAFVVCPRIGGAPAEDDEPDQGAADVDVRGGASGFAGASGSAGTSGSAGASAGAHADALLDVDSGAGSGVDSGAAASGPPRRPPLAVLDVLPLLAEGELAGLQVEALHGRLSTEDKEAVMGRFTRGEVDVLVATTMVEVGVDVPNATVMVVLDADRFGVSQLHQLRGRVGRGAAPGWCLLHTDAAEGTPARERVEAVAHTYDGAELARLDLRERREGDVLGTAQSGRRRTLRLLDLLRHEDVILAARDEATALVDADPALARHRALAAAVAATVDAERAAYLEKA